MLYASSPMNHEVYFQEFHAYEDLIFRGEEGAHQYMRWNDDVERDFLTSFHLDRAKSIFTSCLLHEAARDW